MQRVGPIVGVELVRYAVQLKGPVGNAVGHPADHGPEIGGRPIL